MTNRRFNLLNRAVADSLLWRLLTESVPEHKGKYAAAIAAMVMVATTTALPAWVMGEIVGAMTEAENKQRIYWAAISVFLIFTAKGFVQKQTALFKRLFGQGIAFFNTTESSDLLLRVTQSAQMARNVIDVVVTGFVRDLLTLLGLVSAKRCKV